MHVLFTALPYPSHLRTFIPLGQALLARGHRVTAALPVSAHRYLAPYGFDLVGIDGHDAQPAERPAPAVPEEFAGALAWRNAAEYLRVAERIRPDLVLREDTEFGGYLAAEQLGLPHACIGSCGAANTIDPGWLLPRLDEHRERLGLPADPDGAALYRYRFIDFIPPAYGFARYPIPHARAYRLPLPDHPGEALPPWAANLPADRPLILAAAGTLAQPSAERLARATVEALAELECTAVVVTGADLSAPPNVRIVEYLPQPLLLPSCDLFITHGGLNSVREALQCAVPLVLTPFGADQPNNAERCAAYGFGVQLDPATVTAATLRDACRQVLEDPAFAQRAREAQRHFLTLPDARAAADDLAHLPLSGIGTPA
jgi:UDP:flavonoid glycosyltransferase YjiC (YdhE family)